MFQFKAGYISLKSRRDKPGGLVVELNRHSRQPEIGFKNNQLDEVDYEDIVLMWSENLIVDNKI